MSLVKANGAGDQDTGFYNGVATQSLRFDDASNSFLSKTPSGSDGNRKTWTYSLWFKHGSSTAMMDLLLANGGSNEFFAFALTSVGKFQIFYHDSTMLVSARQLRDRSAWYHIALVHDTTQSTAANRLKIYVNGVKITTYDTNLLNTGNSTTDNNNLPEDFDGGVNQVSVDHFIGRSHTGGNDLDGYLSDVYFLDGTAVGDTSDVLNEFIEIKNGICIPKAYSGSYGTHGYHLKFIGTGTSTSSGAVSDPTNIGDDSSGQNNHWAVSGVDAHDANMPDSPENNFATLNPLDPFSGTLSEGNLKYNNGSSFRASRGGFEIPSSGKWYFEVLNASATSGSSAIFAGLAHADSNISVQPNNGSTTKLYGIYNDSSLGILSNGSQSSNTSNTISADSILQFAIDADNNKFYVGINNSYYSNATTTNGDPSAGSNPTESIDLAGYRPFVGAYSNTGILNCGQDPSFADEITAGTATPSRGEGVFKYAPPTGFLALCNSNLPDTGFNADEDEQPNSYFATSTWNGNGSNNAISGLNFRPDWIWTKDTNGTENHILMDSNRGNTHRLSSNLVAIETTDSNVALAETDSGQFANSDGFTLTQYHDSNLSSSTNIGWSWRMNGGSTASTTATGTTAATTMQRNTTAGISMVTYVGTGTANDTGDQVLAHGLRIGSTDTKPEMMIIKARDYAGGWAVWHKDMGGTLTTDFLIMNTSAGTASSSDKIWDGAEPSTTTFSVGMDWNVNRGPNSLGAGNTANNYVGYFMASVEGFSKIDSFTGNASTDGPFIFTGFRPQFIIAKSVGTGSWHLVDQKLDVNAVGYLNADEAVVYQDFSHYDILSNGFKIRDNGSHTNPSGTVVYAAFAETPFKFANAR